jgi:DNA-binding MarR family transcriptional regulator
VSDEPPSSPPEGAAAASPANVLGALALAITGELTTTVTGALTGEAGGSLTDAAALASLAQFLDGSTVDRVHHVLGLTPSGAVRLVDRLSREGLVTREAGADGRSRSVRLTGAGRDRARSVHDARSSYLRSLLEGLTGDEAGDLHRLLGRVMANVVAAKDGGPWTCRLCDLTACGRDEGRCPAANAARAKYGVATG